MGKPKRKPSTPPVSYLDTIQLADGESLSDFQAALTKSLIEFFEFPEEPGSWHVDAVGDGWLVVCTYEDGVPNRFRTSWARKDASFTFGEFEEVQAVISYKPVAVTTSQGDTTTGAAVATVAGGAKKDKKRGVVVTRPVVSDTAPITDRAPEVCVLIDRAAPATVNRLSDADAANYPKVSPTGKAFLGVYRAGGTIVGRINRNDYLYTDEDINQNIARLKDSIRDAYAHVSSGPNLAVSDLIGAADHPGMFDGESVITSCTMLLDIERIGDDVEIVFGLMDTSIGRDQQALWDYGMPTATSMRSRGSKVECVMNSSDPYFDRNMAYDGRPYMKICDLFIAAFDLVVRPASDTYVQARLDQLTPEVRTQVQDALKRIHSNSYDNLKESEMTKEALRAALKDMSAADLRELAPELAARVAAPLPQDSETPDPAAAPSTETPAVDAEPPTVADPVVVPVTSAEATEPPVIPPPDNATDEINRLKADNAVLKADNAVLRSQLGEITAAKKKADSERADSERRAALEDGIATLCAGRSWGDRRSLWLRERLLNDSTKTVKDLEAANLEFERSDLPALLDAALPAPGEAKTANPGKGEPEAVASVPSSDPLGGLRFAM